MKDKVFHALVNLGISLSDRQENAVFDRTFDELHTCTIVIKLFVFKY